MENIVNAEKGTKTEIQVGEFLKRNFEMHMKRQMHPLRNYFDEFFDNKLFNREETETFDNSER